MPQTPENWLATQLVSTEDGGTNLTNDQFDPKIIHLANGNILVVYSSNADVGAGSPASTDVIGRLYNSLGEAQGDEFRINTALNQSGSERDVEIAPLPNGGFVAVYEDNHNGVNSLRLQEYNPDGTFDFSGVSIIADNNGGTPNYSNPNVSVSSSSQVLVTYEVDNGNGDVDVVAKTYNPQSDSYSSEFTIFDGGAGAGEGLAGHSVTTLENGNYVVAWSDQDGPAGDDDDISFRIVEPDGTVGGTVLVYDGLTDSSDPHVTALTGGGFVMTWVADSSGGSNTGVRARVYGENGVAISSVLLPPTTTPGNQLSPTVASLQDGGFVVVWLDAMTRDIHGQRYDATGNDVGNEFNIDSNVDLGFTAGGIDIDVEGLDDGRFAVTWTEAPASGGIGAFDTDVHMAIWDPRDQENSPNDYIGDQVIGTVGDDLINVAANDRAIYGWEGNDRLVFQTGDAGLFERFDGGDGDDAIVVASGANLDFAATFIDSIEEVEFAFNSGAPVRTVTFGASQVGGGELASDLVVDGFAGGASAIDVLTFNMFGDQNLDLSGFQFQDWEETHDIVVVNGDNSSEFITGSSVRDQIVTAGGNDTIIGGGGFDIMVGGAGNDTYAVDNINDAVIELAGEGSDAVYSSVDIQLAGNVETLILTENAVQGFGDDTDNQIFGNDGVNVLFGQGGNDYLLGLGGDDIFVITPENGAVDVIGDFEDGGAGSGDRIGIAGFGAGADVVQVSQTSFEIRSANGLTTQQFILQGHDGSALVAGDDYYFA